VNKENDLDRFRLIYWGKYSSITGAKASYDLPPPAALGTSEQVHCIDLPDHLGPALGGDGLGLLLDQGDRARLPDIPPTDAGIEPIMPDHDLALVGMCEVTRAMNSR
jgi:hypothetical protein